MGVMRNERWTAVVLKALPNPTAVATSVPGMFKVKIQKFQTPPKNAVIILKFE